MIEPRQQAVMSALFAGQRREALRLAREIVNESPESADGWSLLGIVLSQVHQFGEAEESFRRAIELDKTHVPSLIACSKLFIALRRHDEALTLAIAAADAAPEDFDVILHLGLILAEQRRFSEAASAFSQARSLNPASVTAAKNLALALGDMGEDQQALKAWQDAALLTSRDEDIWLNMAKISIKIGRISQAVEAAKRAVRLAPENGPGQLMLALALSEEGRGEEAEPHLRRALKLDQNNPIAHAALGYWLQEQGRFQEAETELEAALQHQPDHGFAHYNFFRSRKATEADEARLQDLAERADRPGLPIRDRGYMQYALGKAREDLKDFSAAMRHYEAANACAYQEWLEARPWEKEAYADGHAKKRQVFTSERIADLQAVGRPSRRPLFIVGMIRSGTSLMEQIVSSHPDVAGAGELSFWHDHEQDCWGADGLPDPERLQQISGMFVELIQSKAPQARRVTDKLPHNFALIGEIASALPEARFIHCRRSPADNCLSVYTTAYQRPPVFAHDRANIAFAYREYARMMDHWRAVLPADRLLEVSYEEMVQDREAVVRRVIEFIGLPWHEACLRHEENQRAVRTPSLWQVRQPIYTTSMQRWRRFEEWIPEFVELEKELGA